MKEEVLYSMASAYRKDLEIKAYHFGGNDKTLCIVGNMRGNEIQQLYITGQLVKKLRELEEDGKIRRRYGITVIPCVNPYSVNVRKRFWAMDNSDINRMFPGYDKGETTQRIAAGLFNKIQGYKYGVQLTSFYLPGAFVPHVRMMRTDYQDTGLAQLFGLPFAVIRKPVPFDTTTLNFNWQVWDTKAFSLITKTSDNIDPTSAELAEAAVCSFLCLLNIFSYNIYGGYETTILYEEELVSVKSYASGLYVSRVGPFESVKKGDILGEIIDPYKGEVIYEAKAPQDGIVFFAKEDPLAMENETLFRIIGKLHL